MTTTPTASPQLLDLEKLEALARAATPGPWSWWTSNSTLRLTGADGRDGGVLYGYARQGDGDVNCAPNNQAFIAAANPAAVLALIAFARRAQPEGEAPQAGCTVPPEGWYCTRAPGHDGPCAAWPIAQQAAAPAPSPEDCPEDDQQWAKVDPAVAFHLIERHAEDWADAGRLMLQWHNAISRAAQQEPVAAPQQEKAPKPAHGHRDDYYLLANGRRMGLEPISRVRHMPNWVLAMELFATGSTSAHQICRDAGVDPDSTTIQRAAAPKRGA